MQPILDAADSLPKTDLNFEKKEEEEEEKKNDEEEENTDNVDKPGKTYKSECNNKHISSPSCCLESFIWSIAT